MPRKALILSDFLTLYPDQDTYLQVTNSVLSEQWEVTMHSSRYLAGLMAPHSQQKLHEAFISGVIITVAERILKDDESYDIAIGFSIDGTILWKAIENYGLTLSKLICISSTRLRYEKSPLQTETFLVYGEHDQHALNPCLASKIANKIKIISHAGHDFYKHHSHHLKQILSTLMKE